ncbi:MAG: hypothetical protein GC189_06040 [Alphaproteobacteria bacterium]|nr:hypothetical protein [Alphaproteobacteria bacterium]
MPDSDCGDQCGAPPALPTPTAGCGSHCDAPVIPTPDPGCGAACAPPAPPLPQVGCGAACDVAVVVPQPVITGPDVVTVGGAGAAASASSTAIAVAVSDGGEFIYRNGARGYASASAEAGVDSNAEALAGVSANASADGAGDFQRATFSAACVSSDGASAPAAQTFPERDVSDDFVGELYRCAANERMRIDSGRGETLCARGQSLWYARGALTCRTRTPQSAGYERMLMGRFGPGEKVARVQVTAAPQPVALRDASSLTPSSGGVGLSGW